MKYLIPLLLAVPCELLVCTSAVLAHTPYMACYAQEQDTIVCYAEYSDGSSAEGTAIRVTTEDGKILHKSSFDQTGEFTFSKPQVPFTVTMDGGPGHIVREKSDNILP
ncbi:MAG: hypothetical protein AVO34_05975 [Firmicutes bacterium ML8_F2]|nr:MAG: hypothetical protein AVO34_05975 [Firmicutes bacterium ML8_F2]